MKFSYYLFFIFFILLVSCNEKKPAILDIEKEKAAILQIIQKENKAYFEKDLEAWKSTFVQAPYQVRLGTWEGFPENIQYVTSWDSIFNEKVKTRFASPATSQWDASQQEIKNLNFKIFPEVAWVTYEQTDYEPANKSVIGKAIGTRILEKRNGQWKIAYLGFNYYPNK